MEAAIGIVIMPAERKIAIHVATEESAAAVVLDPPAIERLIADLVECLGQLSYTRPVFRTTIVGPHSPN